MLGIHMDGIAKLWSIIPTTALGKCQLPMWITQVLTPRMTDWAEVIPVSKNLQKASRSQMAWIDNFSDFMMVTRPRNFKNRPHIYPLSSTPVNKTQDQLYSSQRRPEGACHIREQNQTISMTSWKAIGPAWFTETQMRCLNTGIHLYDGLHRLEAYIAAHPPGFYPDCLRKMPRTDAIVCTVASTLCALAYFEISTRNRNQNNGLHYQNTNY